MTKLKRTGLSRIATFFGDFSSPGQAYEELTKEVNNHQKEFKVIEVVSYLKPRPDGVHLEGTIEYEV